MTLTLTTAVFPLLLELLLLPQLLLLLLDLLLLLLLARGDRDLFLSLRRSSLSGEPRGLNLSLDILLRQTNDSEISDDLTFVVRNCPGYRGRRCCAP